MVDGNPGTVPATTVATTPAILVLGLGTLISHGFGLALVPAMLPRIADDFGVGYGVLGGAVAVGLVAYSAGGLSAGRILDRVPARVALVGSFAASAIGLLIAGISSGAAMLTVAAAVLGFVAPVSWSATIHVAGGTTLPRSRNAVMATAAGGAALGVLINGVLVQTSDSIHSWRVSFWIAAGLAIVPITLGWMLYRGPIPNPSARGVRTPKAFRRVFGTRPGRVVVLACATAGIAGFPFNVFLTATAIDELGVSSLRAGAVWWLIGVLGVAAGPVLGRYADRTTPLRSLMAGAAMYLTGLIVLRVAWSYGGLLVAAFGYAFMNYPIWGLVGAIANERFAPAVAVRAISLGLISASLCGALGNALAGPWIESSGSLRGPVTAMAALMAVLVAWYGTVTRRGGLDASPERPPSAPRVG